MTAADRYTTADVAAALRRQPSAVRRSARRLGVGRLFAGRLVFTDADLDRLSRARPRRYSADERHDIVQRYQAGQTLAAIAGTFDAPVSSIRAVVRAAGVPLRPVGRNAENLRISSL